MKRLVISLLVLNTLCYAKDKIAIFPFSNQVGKDYGSTLVAEAEMTNQMVKLKRFDVIERSQLETILKEQKLNLTGAISIDQAVEIGKIGGVKYGVLGAINNISYSIDSSYNDQEKKYTKTVSGIILHELKIVDIETAQVIFSNTYKESPSVSFLEIMASAVKYEPEKHFSNTIKNIYEKKVSKQILTAFPVEGAIVSFDVVNKKAIIDIGSEEGVKRGMKFDVIILESRESPRTKKVITIQTKVGIIEVIDVTGVESAICKVKEGVDKIKDGMVVKLKSE